MFILSCLNQISQSWAQSSQVRPCDFNFGATHIATPAHRRSDVWATNMWPFRIPHRIRMPNETLLRAGEKFSTSYTQLANGSPWKASWIVLMAAGMSSSFIFSITREDFDIIVGIFLRFEVKFVVCGQSLVEKTSPM